MDENDRRRALATLQKVYEDLARRAVDTVLENEEGLRAGPYSFAYQELEDRFAPRLMNLGHMIGALQHLQRGRPPQTETRVLRVEAPLAEMDERITEHLRDSPGESIEQMQVVQDDDGKWHAFLILTRTI